MSTSAPYSTASRLHELPADLFPRDFYLGTAMAAYQIEGATHADGRGDSVWDTFCREPGRIKDGSSGDTACEHYHRWPEDLDLMAAMGVQTYRFSIAWPRILPEGTGRINQRGIDFYQRLIDGLLEHGIRPMATLYHWDLPLPLWRDHRGWLERKTAYALADYATVCFAHFGDRVQDWCVLNEPVKIHALGGYELGVHAPGHKGTFADRMAAGHHQLLGYALTKRAFAASGRAGRVGYAEAFNALRPAAPDTPPALVAEARRFEFGLWAEMFRSGRYPLLEERPAFAATLPAGWENDGATIRGQGPDFVGVNYYTPGWVQADAAHPLGWTPGDPPVGEITWRNGLHWPICAQGLTAVLEAVSAEFPGTPLVVSENGFCDQLAPVTVAAPAGTAASAPPDDADRERFIAQHLAASAEAIRRGVPVEGYLYWSFLDNFEWAKGYVPRFGLVGVDYGTQRRVVKRSGAAYAEYLRRRTRADTVNLAR